MIPPPMTPENTMVHSIRFGSANWLTTCVNSQEAWARKYGVEFRIWDEFNPEYPTPKFCEIDMIREFLESDKEWCFYIDADILISHLAEFPGLTESGFYATKDRPGVWSRDFPKWVSKTFLKSKAQGWVYRNAGVWICDRESARKMAEWMQPPYIARCQEQHQFNYWMMMAHKRSGMRVPFLDQRWNVMPNTIDSGDFFHAAGTNKEPKLEKFLRMLHPKSSVVVREFTPGPFLDNERAVVYPYLPKKSVWSELLFSLRSVFENLDDDCPIYILSEKPPAGFSFEPEGRLKWIEAETYQDALQRGLTVAKEVLWMNDDILLLKRVDWEHFRISRHMGIYKDEEVKTFRVHNNTWFQGVAEVYEHLAKKEISPIWNHSTHTPYLFDREKVVEILKDFGVFLKIPLETLYFNQVKRPEPLGIEGYRTRNSVSSSSTILNFTDSLLTDELKEGIEKRFTLEAPWENEFYKESFRKLCDEELCDKAATGQHCYGEFYERILRTVRPRKILEVGIGCKRVMGPIMGDKYVPGASARAISRFCNGIPKIVCVDTDREAVKLALDRERGIHTACLDAYTLKSVSQIQMAFGREFDLVIDDGSHLPQHQKFFAQDYRKLLRPGGVMIVEDITRRVADELVAKYGGQIYERSPHAKLDRIWFLTV